MLTFATHAAFVFANSQLYWDARQLNENLSEALRSRATIDQAVGIILAGGGRSPDEAFQVLVRASNAKTASSAKSRPRWSNGPGKAARTRAEPAVGLVSRPEARGISRAAPWTRGRQTWLRLRGSAMVGLSPSGPVPTTKRRRLYSARAPKQMKGPLSALSRIYLRRHPDDARNASLSSPSEVRFDAAPIGPLVDAPRPSDELTGQQEEV